MPVTSRFARTGWLLILVVGIIAYVAVLTVMVATKNVNFFPSLLLIGAATVPLSVLAFADSVRARNQIPVWSVVMTAVLGGVVGTVTAGVLEYDTLRRLGGVPMLFVGLIEECAKLIVPVVVYLLLRPTRPQGGIVIGVASGMGFAVLETMGYGFQALLASRDVASVNATLLLRGLLSPACHIAWTGLTVSALWAIRSRHGVRRFFGALAVTVVLHALWDGSTIPLVHIVIAVGGYVSLLVLIRRAGRDDSSGLIRSQSR